jgi:hypothetical protein
MANVLPAPILTLAGTETTLGSELFKSTIAPLEPAGLPSDTAPETGWVEPPMTDSAVSETPIRPVGSRVSCAVLALPLSVAEIAATATRVTADVAIGKDAEADPAETTTDGPTEAAELLEESWTTVPPAGAEAVSVTVPVAGSPPSTVVGAIARLARVGGKTVRAPDAVDPWYAPMIVATVVAVTGIVVTEKVADVAPEAIVTDAGTTTDPLPDES